LNTSLSYLFLGGRIHFRLDRAIASELLSYGKFITGSSIVLFIAMEVDSAVIGKVLGTEQLGFYTLAFMIANLATANLSRVASTIMMPAYSKLQADVPALRRAYLRTLALVMFLVLPAACGLVVVAGPLLELIYGAKWLPATAPLQILALFGLFRALASFSGFLFEGIGMPKIGFQLGVVRLVVIAPLIVPMSMALGLPGAALTVTVGMAIQWLAGIFYLRRKLGVRIPELLRVVWRPVWTAATMALLVYFVQISFSPGGLLALLGTVGLGVVTYMLLNIPQLRELKSFWRKAAD
jgi:PST family polysaccharide transporter/lipopolysaccharide exporter